MDYNRKHDEQNIQTETEIRTEEHMKKNTEEEETSQSTGGRRASFCRFI